MGIRVIERVVRLALAVALAVSGVAMVSHHAAGASHELVAHGHSVAAHENNSVAETNGVAEAGAHHEVPGAACADCETQGHDALLMSCAALLTALFVSVRLVPPAGAPLVAAAEPANAVTVSPHTEAVPTAPCREELSVIRQ
ncbi:hypothetical protein EV141_1889 [Microcella putealis]|uniref:DUF2946 family protein n=1 Tax=Microcella putealis TaxID=337005 RepID=A0A4Q7LNZ8_9MICO|nr:hypothetical protein [Microcella putealis]RZS56425.1 hypothetical protein EV141_1889 [Microcella putealis]TQM27089.1 hypothetical protein BJ957_0512 [Microcella putealis]